MGGIADNRNETLMAWTIIGLGLWDSAISSSDRGAAAIGRAAANFEPGSARPERRGSTASVSAGGRAGVMQRHRSLSLSLSLSLSVCLSIPPSLRPFVLLT